jgi:hypothetical protein
VARLLTAIRGCEDVGRQPWEVILRPRKSNVISTNNAPTPQLHQQEANGRSLISVAESGRHSSYTVAVSGHECDKQLHECEAFEAVLTLTRTEDIGYKRLIWLIS